MKHELQNIISGKSQVRYGDAIQAISRYLRKSKRPSGTIESSKQIKRKEATLIKQFCDKKGNVFFTSQHDFTKNYTTFAP
jgi:hypothetical protein